MKIKDEEGSSASIAAKSHQYLNYHVFRIIYQEKWTHHKFQKPETDKNLHYSLWRLINLRKFYFLTLMFIVYVLYVYWTIRQLLCFYKKINKILEYCCCEVFLGIYDRSKIFLHVVPNESLFEFIKTLHPSFI